jgi:hypothetical protein
MRIEKIERFYLMTKLMPERNAGKLARSVIRGLAWEQSWAGYYNYRTTL